MKRVIQRISQRAQMRTALMAKTCQNDTHDLSDSDIKDPLDGRIILRPSINVLIQDYHFDFLPCRKCGMMIMRKA
jgi:hypothetical protein